MFIRSTAAGDRLGGLAPATRAAAAALAAAFDVVVIETVGVGQSETDVAEVADTVAVVVQPASGDVLQFLKAGIMEIPDVLVVTKADLGARRHAGASPTCGRAALARRRRHPVVAVSSVAAPEGDRELVDALDAHRAALTSPPAGSAPGGCTRSRTSPPSTASGGCARSAAGGRPSGGWPSRTPALDVPALDRGAGARRRASGE